MSSFRSVIEPYCDLLGETGDRMESVEIHGIPLPEDHRRVLAAANGAVSKHGFFRLFGTRPVGSLTSLIEWNTASWRAEYGDVFTNMLVIAADVFGDQYGYVRRRDGTCVFVKLSCEGAAIHPIAERNLEDFLLNRVFRDRPTAFEHRLALAALQSGLRPDLSQHLAFSLPLICGGERELRNLGVESISLHFGLLAQLTRQNADLPNGTPISRFSD